MMRLVVMVLILHVSAPDLLATGSARTDFEAMASVMGELTPNVPVRVPLTPAILTKARPTFADIRLYDDHGLETPYVIYRQTTIRQAPVSFEFDVVSYQQTGSTEELTLRRPNQGGPFVELELDIAGADFNKRVEVAAGAHLAMLQPVANDVIFDFSSRVDLRKTRVRFAETDASFVRITLTDIGKDERRNPEMKLRYEGLEFWTAGATPGPFRIDRIIGWAGEKKSAEHYYDRVAFTQITSQLDDAGNTVVYLDAKLPVAQITLHVANSYYYRRVQPLTSPDGVEPYGVARTGVIYKVPGMLESKNTVRFELPASHLRLKILNQDNPPLDIQGVEIAWVRRNLYFVPEPDRTYELYVGSDIATQPHYELKKLIPSDHLQLAGYAEMALTALLENPAFDPAMRPATREVVEKTVLVVVVVILVCALAMWSYRLLTNVPRETSE